MPNRAVVSIEEFWQRYDQTEARLTRRVSERMTDLARLRPGMRVLDLATGRGEPAIVAAQRVAPDGYVLGVDLSAPMLAMARERAAREGVSNLRLQVANAELLDGVPGAHFHATLTRWGLMYMASPVSALVGARRSMLPGGLLVAALWAEPERAPYFSLPRRELAKYRPLPPLDLESAGTFRFSDPERIHRDFAKAGFTIEHVEEMDVAVIEAETGQELEAWARGLGLTKLLNELPESAQQAWESDFVNALESLRNEGLIRLGGVTRIVVASVDETSTAT